MELSPSLQDRVAHQFDCLIKQVLKGEARNCKAKLARRAAHETNFSDLGDSVIENICVNDEHKSDYFCFEINGFGVVIKNELLGEAVNSLSEQKRNIILLSYFLDVTDYQIADFLKLVRSTVTYHRESALEMLKKFMEEMTDDERNP